VLLGFRLLCWSLVFDRSFWGCGLDCGSVAVAVILMVIVAGLWFILQLWEFWFEARFWRSSLDFGGMCCWLGL